MRGRGTAQRSASGAPRLAAVMPLRSRSGAANRSAATRPLDVLAVGQTPPPYGGQAIAIESFVTGRYEKLRVHHVRMGFSAAMGEVGKLRWGKLTHLVALVLRILRTRWRTKARVLYYPPAGPDLVPVVRDLVILLAIRWSFPHTVFHFHAGGISEIYPRLPRWVRPLYWRAYGRPDVAIQPSALNPPDGQFLQAREVRVVPNGVRDCFPGSAARDQYLARPHLPAVLYVGVLRESKGLLVLVEAAAELRRRGVVIELKLMGQFESPAFERTLRQALAETGVEQHARLLGVLTGEAKYQEFLTSDVFCYPTHFESETFGIVLVEAMQFELPVVATDWRGVPTSVTDGHNGFLVPVRDATALADKLQLLIEDPQLAREMGRRGREVYIARFTEERYREMMEEALGCVGGADRLRQTA